MKTLYRKTGNLVETDISISITTREGGGKSTRTGYGEEAELPTDNECFDAFKALQKELTESGRKPDFLDPNSWLMACNWMKDFLTEEK